MKRWTSVYPTGREVTLLLGSEKEAESCQTGEGTPRVAEVLSLSALLANKQKPGRAGSCATFPVRGSQGWHWAARITERAQGSLLADPPAVAASGRPAGPAQCAATRAQSAPHARGPAGALDYKSQQAQRQRGAGSGAIPRDPARWEAPRRTQRRPEGGERGRGRGRRGPEPCVPGRGLAGQRRAALGAVSAAGKAPTARSRLGGRRRAAEGPGARGSAALTSERTQPQPCAPERSGHCPGASAPALAAPCCLRFNGCSAGRRVGVRAAAAREGARASLLRGRPRSMAPRSPRTAR